MNLNLNQFEDGVEITSYMATGYAEGFEETSNPVDIIKAWAYLIRTGMAWSLQGSFGRTASGIIDSGLISDKGDIDFDLLDEKLHAHMN